MTRTTLKTSLLALAFGTMAGLSAFPLPAAAQVVPGEEHCIINVASDDQLNLRRAPNATGQIVAGLRPESCGIVVTGACQGNWCPVEDGHNAGWVNRRYISMV